jgi:hypothetical protein
MQECEEIETRTQRTMSMWKREESQEMPRRAAKSHFVASPFDAENSK